jgi:hypothetical protein
MYLSPFGDADLLGTHEVTLTLTLAQDEVCPGFSLRPR